MGRPKGSKNLTADERKERNDARKVTKKTVKKVTASKGKTRMAILMAETPESEPQFAPYGGDGAPQTTPTVVPAIQTQDPVLNAIDRLTNYVTNGFASFDKRMSDLENGRVQTVTQSPNTYTQSPNSHTQSPETYTGYVPTAPSTMVVDNDPSTLPKYTEAQLEAANLEADGAIKAMGIDKLQKEGMRDTVHLGRETTGGGRWDVVCHVCKRPPAPAALGGRGALPHDFIPTTGEGGVTTYVYCHENCLPGMRR